MQSISEKMNFYKTLIEQRLADVFPAGMDEDGFISDACRYSLLAGGKRIRPVFCMAVAQMLKTPYEKVIVFACAIEMIHTFSLIHDDLPGMDNDDFRRGMPTCHRKYGEGIAILAGDALLNKAYEIMINDCISYPEEGKIKALGVISEATGIKGMIGGQGIDLLSEKKKISYELLRKMHSMKTGALLKAPIISAALISCADSKTLEELEKYSDNIGLAFQIKDDILDVVSTSEVLGKTAGKDAETEKSTYVTLLGLDGARLKLSETVAMAGVSLENLQRAGFDVEFLKGLTKFLLERES
jgi:geranylgeranyl diphosphate synthase type II